jgi:mRNA interferase MazF
MGKRKAPNPERGEIWLVRFDPAIGAEIRKTRPAIVVSVGDVGRLPLRIVVPITDWQSRYAPMSWLIHLPATAQNGLTKDSAADAFQVKSIAEHRFVKRLGRIDPDQILEIANAIALCVGAH